MSTGEPARATAGGLRLGVLLTSAMALSTAMQFTIGALGPAIRADLGVSRTALGALSAAYYLVAAVLSRPLGRRIDVVPARAALVALFVGTALAMGAAAATGTYLGLLVAVLPAGAAAAAGNPVTNRIIAHLPGRHGTLVAVKQSGVQLGALGIGAVLPVLAVAIGWRGALACVAAICVASVVMTGWTPRIDRAEAPGDTPRPGGAGVGTLAVYAFFMGAGMSTVTSYLPLYGHDRVGLGQAAAGSLLALVGAGGVISRLWWTRLHERRADRGRGRGATDILVGLAVAALAATAAVVAAEAAGPWLLWIAAALLGLSASAWNALAMLAVVERTPAEAAAGTSGTVVAAFYLGLCLSAPVFGLAVDTIGSYDAGWALTAASFAVAAAVARRRPAGG